jgi:hypothetical protein
MDVPVIPAQTPCENCRQSTAVAIAPSGGFVYLGCSACGQIWSIRDRRREARADEIRERKSEV